MPTVTISTSLTVPGQSADATTVSVEADTMQLSAPEVAAAKDGVLTVRTDDNTGSLTMESGHGITTGVKLDLFWDGGQRRGMTVGTVASLVVPIDLGAGDNLPTAATVITAMVPHEEAFVAVGNNITAAVVSSDRKGYVVFAQADGTVILGVKIGDDGDTYYWFNDTALNNPVMITNPFAGVSVGKIFFSHDDPDAAHSPSASVFFN